MVWILDKSCQFVAEMDSHENYPKTLIGNYMATAKDTHDREVKAYADRISARREEEKQAAADKIAEKQRRKDARAAKRRAEDIAKLR